MPSERRVFGRREFAECGLALGASLLGGCASDATEGHGTLSGAGGSGGAASSAGGGGSSGVIQLGPGGSAGSLAVGNSGLGSVPIGTPPASACNAANGGLFCGEIVWNQAPARRVLYSWTTAEQIEELRTDPVLFTRSESPGLGRGYAFTSIEALAGFGSAAEKELLSRLSSELFQKVRFAWPSPWATRMGWPGEDYGDRLVEITLRPEALIVVVRDNLGMAVIDLENRVVPVEQALGDMERIGAVYFVRTEVSGSGSYSTCSGGFREFILGNEAMVERWAIETADMRAHLEADTARIDRFFEILRGTVPALDPTTFGFAVACQWDYGATSEVDIYLRSLALSSELYLPRPAELAILSETLRQSLFEPNPLVVEPGG